MCCECNSFVVQAYLPSWCFVCSSFSECFGSEIKFYDGGRNDVGWVCPCRRVIRELHNSPANPVAVLEKSGQLFLPSSSSSVSSCDYRCTFCLFVCLFAPSGPEVESFQQPQFVELLSNCNPHPSLHCHDLLLL